MSIQDRVTIVKRHIDEIFADPNTDDRQMKAILGELRQHCQDKLDTMPKSAPMNAQGPAGEMEKKLAGSA